MKKIILGMMLVFAMVSVTSANTNEENLENKPSSVEQEQPADCWAGANAAEIYSCGSIGCNFDLWAAVYSACSGQ
ncbi:MAG TPA: hypothetical protein VLM44_07085 [Lutibacter sp.]|nr:hypothetical protein [Lutibacter sp.]